MKNIIYAFILFSVYHESLKAEVSIQVYDRQKDGREFIVHGIIDNKPKGESPHGKGISSEPFSYEVLTRKIIENKASRVLTYLKLPSLG